MHPSALQNQNYARSRGHLFRFEGNLEPEEISEAKPSMKEATVDGQTISNYAIYAHVRGAEAAAKPRVKFDTNVLKIKAPPPHMSIGTQKLAGFICFGLVF